MDSREDGEIQLELEMCDQELSGITIVARSNCCADRLKNIAVRAGMRSVPDGFKGRWGVNTQAAVFAGPATEGQFYRINFGRKIQAKYITIQSLDKGVTLEINEVMLASEGWELGWCLDSSGNDQNSGTVSLGLKSSMDQCLYDCKKTAGATGCEYSRNYCSVHTQDVASGSGHSSHQCYVLTEKVDGGWSEWGSWGACNQQTAKQARYRNCNNPPPFNGGAKCPGSN